MPKKNLCEKSECHTCFCKKTVKKNSEFCKPTKCNCEIVAKICQESTPTPVIPVDDDCTTMVTSNNCNNPKAIKRGIVNLASNILSIGTTLDANLVNSWGIIVDGNIIWVSNNGTGTVTAYDLDGKILGIVVNITTLTGSTAQPTGIVYNATNGFRIRSGSLLLPALWLVATQQGTINAYQPAIDPLNANVIINKSASGASYTGITISDAYLYATDFHNNRIDVFNKLFEQQFSFSFIDPNPIANYAPFNIYYMKGKLYVAYAIASQTLNGYINVFNTDGSFVRRFSSCDSLNAPWGIVGYPESCNSQCDNILVGNHADDRINFYDKCGNYVSNVKFCDGSPIIIDGLWGLATNNAYYDDAVYFASGPNNGINGLIGKIINSC